MTAVVVMVAMQNNVMQWFNTRSSTPVTTSSKSSQLTYFQKRILFSLTSYNFFASDSTEFSSDFLNYSFPTNTINLLFFLLFTNTQTQTGDLLGLHNYNPMAMYSPTTVPIYNALLLFFSTTMRIVLYTILSCLHEDFSNPPTV